MIAEIGRAVADGVPLIVCVPARHLAAWDAFACGLDAKLAPTREAIESWWAARGALSSKARPEGERRLGASEILGRVDVEKRVGRLGRPFDRGGRRPR